VPGLRFLAFRARDAGLQMEDLRGMLRHTIMASTEVYAKLSVRRRNDYLKRLDESDAVVKAGR
jgi:hypothetical protein